MSIQSKARFADMVLEFLREAAQDGHIAPEDVFEASDLNTWAEENGWLKPDDIDVLVECGNCGRALKADRYVKGTNVTVSVPPCQCGGE